MKPQTSFVGTVQGNLHGDRIKMGIGEGAEDIIIAMVTDLYMDPELAIVREYCTNARDSHIEAGNDAPIEVSTPSELSPYFIVKDFGVGLSVNDLKTVYSQYGASSKRESDDYNGLLGVGSKSALAYTEQFTVSAVKNGVKAQVVVTRDEDMRPVMEIVDTRGTDEPNGVEIRIPAKYGSRIHEKAAEFLGFWNPKTVLLNGQTPDTIFDQDYKKITETIYSFPNLRDDYVVMGNVAYALKNNILSQAYSANSWSIGTVAFVEMGDVAFPPNRESVAYTPHTNATLARLVKEIEEAISEQILADISGSASHADAFKAWRKWYNIVGSSNMPQSIFYKGDQFIQRINNVRHTLYMPRGGRYTSNGRTGRAETNTSVYLESLIDDKNHIVTGFTKADLTSTDKAKIKVYLEENGLSKDTTIYLFDKIPGAPWTNEVESIKWEEIKSIKLNKNKDKTRGLIGSIPILVFKDAYWTDLEELDADEDIYYLSPSKDERWSEDDVAIRMFQELHPNAQIIKLGKNRWGKLLREYPEALHIDGEMGRMILRAESLLTAEDKVIMTTHTDDMDAVAKYSKFTIDDPDLDALRDVAALDTTRVDLYNRVYSKFGMYGKRKFQPTGKSIMVERYPLISQRYSFRDCPEEHDVIYMNAVYAAKYKENK
jgi:hypothetical protein